MVEDLRRAGKTIIAIAHQLSTIRGADKIVVLGQGAIIAEGRHAGLLKTMALTLVVARSPPSRSYTAHQSRRLSLGWRLAALPWHHIGKFARLRVCY
ncbi:hypothetical protein CO664_27045 [Sinorhizobium sp. NG07B]|nr:hypothetical protein CO664_27045 [Sinorhizobium sp. NG07B]